MMLHSVDTTVFGFSPGNLFNVDGVAKRSLIISSVAAATGLFVDVWFVFVYSGADAGKFQVSRCFLLSTWGSTVLTIFYCDIHRRSRWTSTARISSSRFLHAYPLSRSLSPSSPSSSSSAP
jgi:hypothetical protein